ncbi:hypothetical protein B0H10DRAFT_19123 [Mycena sp. CBHHK59/15]|nr:hypothetical protein B0H10DRAFT_19123 [Mycena sp. CBHHK59/15]
MSRGPRNKQDEKSPQWVEPSAKHAKPGEKQQTHVDDPRYQSHLKRSSSRSPEIDELNITSTTRERMPLASTSQALSSSEPRVEQRTGLLTTISSAFKNLVSGPPDDEAPSCVTSDEANAYSEMELKHLHQEWSKINDELRATKERISVLDANEKLAQKGQDARLRDAQVTIQRLKRDLQTSQTERANIIETGSKKAEKANTRIHSLTETVSKLNAKIEDLTRQKVHLNGEIKHMRVDAVLGTSTTSENSSLDPFKNKLDQVSEAHIKSGVESLNDSMNAFIMSLIERTEDLAQIQAPISFSSPHHPDTPLCRFLASPDMTVEARGFMLDVLLHDELVKVLDQWLFSGAVASRTIDSGGMIEHIFEEISRREPWTVSQRWRAVTATSIGTKMDGSYYPVKEQCEKFLAMLAWAYRVPVSTFSDSTEIVCSGLDALFDEANKLVINCRRDVLSVCMSIIVAPHSAHGDFLPFDPERSSSVWPEMGAAAGDQVVGMYKFGLQRLTESREISYLLLPQVATAALMKYVWRMIAEQSVQGQ